RHTGLSRDWSSDVCSSDLLAIANDFLAARLEVPNRRGHLFELRYSAARHRAQVEHEHLNSLVRLRRLDRIDDIAHERLRPLPAEIGRASCRRRGSEPGAAR